MTLIDHYYAQNFSQEYLNLNSEVRRMELIDQIHRELQELIAIKNIAPMADPAALNHFSTFGQAFQGKNNEIGQDPKLCSLDICAYAYIMEER